MKLLPIEDLIKALDEKGIEYNRGEIEDAYFPLKDVEACMDGCRSFIKHLSDRRLEDKANHRPCPLCGKPSEELKWIYFDSPKWTWENLMGRAGPMSICPDCGCIVEFIRVILN
jgi:hypothetical protein